MKTFVVIRGQRLSGKDTVAKALRDSIISRGGTAEILHFADALREEVMDMINNDAGLVYKKAVAYGLDYDQVPYQFKDPVGFYPITDIAQLQDNSLPSKDAWRWLLIQHGKDQREVEADYWIRRTYEMGQDLDVDAVIIPDCRFDNEIKFFEEGRGVDHNVCNILIETVRPELHARGWKFTHGTDDDISELQMDGNLTEYPWDYFLVDTGFDFLTYDRSDMDHVMGEHHVQDGIERMTYVVGRELAPNIKIRNSE